MFWKGLCIAPLMATLSMLSLLPLGGRLVNRLAWRFRTSPCWVPPSSVPGNATIAIALISDGFSAAANCHFLRDCRYWGRRRFGSPATVRRGRVACAGRIFAGGRHLVVMRQAGFAVGIAVLGAVLHNQEAAISYIWLFAAAAMASAAVLVAALVVLPAPAGPSKK